MSSNSTSNKIRDIAALLTDDTSKAIMKTIKTKLLSLANELEKQRPQFLPSSEFDDLLLEIENKYSEENSNVEEENKRLIEGFQDAFHGGISQRYIANNYSIFCGKWGVHKETFILLFITPKDFQNAYYAPSFDCRKYNINEEDLLNIWNDVPEEIKVQIPNTDLKQINMSREGEFAEWFVNYGKYGKAENQQTYKIMYESMLHYAHWSAFKNYYIGKNVEKMSQYYNKYKKYININQQSLHSGETLLHTAVGSIHSKPIIDWLYMEGINDTLKDNERRTAIDLAKKYGKWEIVTMLTFKSMSDKMREKADEQIVKLSRNKGIIKQWFRFYVIDNIESDEYKSMLKMTESIKILIKNRLPISDDLLLLCLSFEMDMKENNGNPLKCSLWKCLYDTLNDVLRIPLNRRNWLWFKHYIFPSCIWYQKLQKPTESESKHNNEFEDSKDNEDRLLYHLLIEMVAKQLSAQRDYLKPFVNKLENKTENKEDDSWEKLKNYPEFIATDNAQGLRQDECMDKITNEELLPYPIRPIFSNEQLTKLDLKVNGFNCCNYYDVNGYLAKLILIAHSLNDKFHEAMKMIFNVENELCVNMKDGLTYLQGPVKRLGRCQAKAETDYSHCTYPTTSKIVDFIRCCLVFENSKDLLNGIDKFKKAINDNNSDIKQYIPCMEECGKVMQKCVINDVSKYNGKCNRCSKTFQTLNETYFKCEECERGKLCFKCGEERILLKRSVKKILRIKNMFLDNKRENNNKWDLYKYADIKMGVLMEYDGQSMIVEVQFLLNWMLSAKSLGHGLYEIERNKDFIFDVNTMMNLRTANEGNIDTMLKNAVITGNENELATLILNEAPVNLMITDSNKDGLLHIAITEGHKKVIKLMLDTMQSDRTSQEFCDFINMTGEYFTPLHHCVYRKDSNLFKLFLQYSEVDCNAKSIDSSGANTPLLDFIKEYDGKGKMKQILNMIMSKDNIDRFDFKTINKGGENVMICACINIYFDIEFIKRLYSMGHYDINYTSFPKINTGSELTEQPILMNALMKACCNWKYIKSENKKIRKANIPLIEFLLSIPNIDINYVNKMGNTPVDYAISQGLIDVVNIFCNHKDFNWKAGKLIGGATIAKNSPMCNKLVQAILSGNVDMCKFVMKHCPNIEVNGVDITNRREPMRPINVAVLKYDVQILEYVLSLPNIKIDVCDRQGFTPWLRVCDGARLQHAKILYNCDKKNQINFNRKYKGKQNAMDLAIESGIDEMINWLTSVGFTKTDEIQLPTLEGWLKKKQKTPPYSWRNRWVILKDGHFLWTDTKMTIQDPRNPKERAKFIGFLSLMTIIEVSSVLKLKKQDKFKIVNSEGKNKKREYLFKAGSQNDRDYWVESLQMHINYMNESTS